MIERGSPCSISDYSDTARILIVDDDPAAVRLLAQFLGAAGYRCLDSTTDSREALGRFRATQPDIILVDLVMPHLDGLDVLAQLRAEIDGSDYVPVVLMAADAGFDVKRRALSAGVHDFLAKPFEQIEVVLRVSNLLKTRRLYRTLAAQTRCANEVRWLARHAFAFGEQP